MESFFLGLVVLLILPSANGTEVNLAFGKVIEKCAVKNPKSHVWIFKQWHLGPNVNTRKQQSDLPQAENQTAIFDQIDEWVKNKNLKVIYSEGCSGEINENFTRVFNGWTLKDLTAVSDSKDYDKIISLIPLKIKAKYRDQVSVYCADDDTLINKQNGALSDARGNLGFLGRIEQYKGDPQKVKPFLEKIIELDHLPQGSTPEVALKKIKSDIKENISQAFDGINQRNEKFASAVKPDLGDSALVVGGLHAKGLVELFKKKNIDCSVVEPKGYHSEDEKVISELEPSRK
jgi:hypothetical protein